MPPLGNSFLVHLLARLLKDNADKYHDNQRTRFIQRAQGELEVLYRNDAVRTRDPAAAGGTTPGPTAFSGSLSKPGCCQARFKQTPIARDYLGRGARNQLLLLRLRSPSGFSAP